MTHWRASSPFFLFASDEGRHGDFVEFFLLRKTGRWAGITSLAVMWIMIIVTELFVLNSTWLRILLIAVGVTGTVFKLRFFFGKPKIT